MSTRTPDPRDVQLTRSELAERWRDAAIHASNAHHDEGGFVLALVAAMAQLEPNRRWSVKHLQEMLLGQLAALPYVEGCCTWRSS